MSVLNLKQKFSLIYKKTLNLITAKLKVVRKRGSSVIFQTIRASTASKYIDSGTTLAFYVIKLSATHQYPH